MTRVRLVDVAREAGVSIGAASDALAGKNRIPEETRRRVREAAERLGYTPNRVARALRSGRLPLIGLVIPSLRRPGEFAAYRAYWGAVIGAGTLAATECGYGFVVLPGLTGPGVPDVPLAGINVVDVSPDDPDLEQALSLGVPVLSDGAAGDPRLSVRLDPDYQGHVDQAMDHLRALGARRIALVMPTLDSLFGREVRRAHRSWCERNGAEALACEFDLEASTVAQALDEVLAHRPDALYLVYSVGPDIEEVIARHGRTLGGDLLLLVQDEDTAGDLARRGLSTIGYSIEDFTTEAVRLLVEVIEGRATPPLTVARSFTIVDRASTLGAPAPGSGQR